MGKKTSSPKSKTSFKSAISPPIKTADDSVDPVKAAQAALTEKKRKRGPIKDLFQKVGSKVGIVEQTKIAPEFAAKLEGYAWYQKYADNLVEYIETVLQPDPKVRETQKLECARKKDPIERFRRTILRLCKFVEKGTPMAEKLEQVQAVIKQAAVMEREHQVVGRRSIRKLRVFVVNDCEEFTEKRQKLLTSRDIMDSARHDLKKAKTTEAVELKGRIYEQSVYEFNEVAETLDKEVDSLELKKLIHEKQICDFFEVKGMHHRNAAAVLYQTLAVLGTDGYNIVQ